MPLVPPEFDPQTLRPLPMSLHLCFWVLMRSLILFVLALASRDQGSNILALFYPEPHHLYLALATNVPAALIWLAGAYRHRAGHPLWHTLWRTGFWVCLLTAWLQVGLAIWLNLQTGLDDIGMAQLALPAACVWYLLRKKGLRTLFRVDIIAEEESK